MPVNLLLPVKKKVKWTIQVSLWDISLEADGVYTEPADNELNKLPPQLLFIHMGQNGRSITF